MANQPITWQQLKAFRCCEDDLLKFKLSIRMEKKGDLNILKGDLGILKTPNLLGFACTTISRVYRERSEKENISCERQLCGWKCLVDVRRQRRMSSQQICSNCMMLSCQYGPKSLKNVSNNLLNLCHEEFAVLKAKGGQTRY